MKCLIFDLDGTLLNTLSDLATCVNHALECHGFPKRSMDEVKSMVGNGVEMLIRRAVPKGCDESTIATVLDSFKKHYLQHSEDTTLPYPGIIDMLNKAKADGHHTAVVSNKFDAATKRLCDKYFPGLIDIAIGEDEKHGIRKKPAPDSVLSVISTLREEKDNCIYIGDSDVDIETAKAAGIKCIAVSWGFRPIDFLKAHGAESIVNDTEQLYLMIKSE